MKHDPRDLEWQRRYEAGDTPWDKGAAAPPLAAFLPRGEISGRVLVPGCGKGHDVRALGNQPGISAVGLDLSSAAIDEAKSLGDSALAGQVSFVVGDFLHLPRPLKSSFNWVVEHTCFCALDPAQRGDYVLAASSALRAEGRLFGIFFIHPDTETGPPFAVSTEELSQLFNPHFHMVEEWVPKESFAGRENRELVRILQKR